MPAITAIGLTDDQPTHIMIADGPPTVPLVQGGRVAEALEPEDRGRFLEAHGMDEKVTDALSAERDAYLRQRDEAIGERNELLRQRDEAIGERNEFLRQRDVAIGERNEILRQRDAWIGTFNELERQIDYTIEDRNLPGREEALWRIREIVQELAYEPAAPDEDEKLNTRANVLRCYIMAGAIAILVLPFVLLPITFLAAWGWYDRARQRSQVLTAKPDSPVVAQSSLDQDLAFTNKIF
jgi:hypothetical protein